MRVNRTPLLLALLGGSLLLAACGAPQTADPASSGAAGTSARPVAATNVEAFAAAAAREARDQVDAAEASMNASLLSAADGDFRAARAELEALVADPVAGGYALHNLGVIAFYEGQAQAALDYYQRAMERDPLLAAPVVATVRMLLRQGDTAGAQRIVDRQVAASGGDPGVRAAGLLIALHNGRNADVIRDGRAILLVDDDNLDVFVIMAEAYQRAGQAQLGRFILEQGIERDATRADLHFGLARIEIAAGNNPGARAHLQRALEAEPHHPEAWNNLGLMLFRARAFEDAVDAFQNAVRFAPDYKEAWLNLGNAQKGVVDPAAAQTSFERAAQIDSRYPDPHFNLGVLYLESELGGLAPIPRYERAISYFRRFIELSGSVPADHAVHEYIAEAERQVQTIRELESRPSAPPATETGGGADDPFGDDPFGDDPFGDEEDPFGDEEDPFGDLDFD